MNDWAEETDVLVFGSGAGGMSATLFAAKKGAQVLLCEKTLVLGGTTATSGGVAWIPNSEDAKAAGIDDSFERARGYLKHSLGNYYRADLIDAFLESGPQAIAELQNGTEVKFDVLAWPDYNANHVDAARKGRALETRRFDGRKLGKDFDLIRTPMKRLMLFGKLSVDKRKVDDFLNPFRTAGGFLRVLQTLGRFGADLFRYSRGTDIGAGNALIARIFYSLRAFSTVSIWTNAALVELIADANGVQGAIVNRQGKHVKIRARRGIILATGGFPRSPELRAELSASQPFDQTAACEANVGDAITAARRIGGSIDINLNAPGLWSPMSKLVHRDGTEESILYGYLDRGRPGLVAVDGQGRRFVNESNSYHEIGLAMFERGIHPNQRFFFICDRKFVWKRGLGLIRPFQLSLRRFINSKYITVARTLPELATRIGVDPAALVDTINKHNEYAKTGKDIEYGRGDNPYNWGFGDPAAKPNPNLSPIASPPYVALQVYPGALGTFVGLKTSADGQVVDESDRPIPRLYACGNDLASIMRGFAPAGGITIGPAITFAFRAVNHALAAGK